MLEKHTLTLRNARLNLTAKTLVVEQTDCHEEFTLDEILAPFDGLAGLEIEISCETKRTGGYV